MLFAADFETTTDVNDCRVWAWAVCEIGNTSNFVYGNSMESFIHFISTGENSTFYFHNLKFDGAFIISHLLKNGYKHRAKTKEFDPVKNKMVKIPLEEKEFSTLISDKGQWYTMQVMFSKGNKRSKNAKFVDSLKIINLPVAQVAKAFDLPVEKLEIDYKAKREVGHILTPEEIAYIRNDVTIMALALNTLFNQDLKKITVGGNALHDYKKTVDKKQFKRWFPMPDDETDKDMRQAYKGGFTYVPDEYKGKDLSSVIVLDVNSLYPSVMRNKPLPYGYGVFYEGEYQPDPIYNMYIQRLVCQFELKDNHIPMIQLKHLSSFIPNQYIKSSGDEEVPLTLTNVDFELFKQHYHIYNCEFRSGWKFKSTTGMFTAYVDKWNSVKMQATIDGNKGMRTISKLMLNNLYGKYAVSPVVASNNPYLDNGVLKFYAGDKEHRDPLYIPVGAFITAWARYITISSAQKVYPLFRYADTDSLHLEIPLGELSKLSSKELEKLTTADLQKYGIPIPDDFEIDPVKLGAWKVESIAHRARFIRQKCYVEDSNPPETWNKEKYSTAEVKKYCEQCNIDFDEEIKKYSGCYDTDILKITCAGMPKTCYSQVTWENFHEGATYSGKLQPKQVEGGVVLIDTDYTIKPSLA